MSTLDQIATFVAVVEAGGITAAARDLGLPKSTVSRHVVELEDRLGIQLLHRTTRAVRPTEVGERFYAEAQTGVAALRRAERTAELAQQEPRGILRVTVVPHPSLAVGQLVDRYLTTYPSVEVELRADPHVVDLVRDGFDVAIRAGLLPDSTLITRSLLSMESVLCAAPAYLEAHGRPRRPAELATHQCILFGTDRIERGGSWQLHRGKRTTTVQVRGRVRLNEPQHMADVCRGGHGIAMLPHAAVAEDIAEGRLERVLPDWNAGVRHLQVVFPSNRLMDSKTRAFVDMAVEFFASAVTG